MANWAMEISKRALQRHGMDLKYTTIVRVVDEAEGTVIESPTTYVLRIYPLEVVANQYNYPTLVDKKVVEFKLVNDNLGFQIKMSDTIEYQGEQYRINSYQGHVAQGQVVYYDIVGVRG